MFQQEAELASYQGKSDAFKLYDSAVKYVSSRNVDVVLTCGQTSNGQRLDNGGRMGIVLGRMPFSTPRNRVCRY